MDTGWPRPIGSESSIVSKPHWYCVALGHCFSSTIFQQTYSQLRAAFFRRTLISFIGSPVTC